MGDKVTEWGVAVCSLQMYGILVLSRYEPAGRVGCLQGFGGKGSSSLATMTLSKLHCLCAPSQNGLFADCPQRQRDTAVLPARPNTRPCASTISKSPSTRIEPLSLIRILVPATYFLQKFRCSLRSP